MDKITHQVRCERWTKIINECLASGMKKQHGAENTVFHRNLFSIGNAYFAKKPIFHQ